MARVHGTRASCAAFTRRSSDNEASACEPMEPLQCELHATRHSPRVRRSFLNRAACVPTWAHNAHTRIERARFEATSNENNKSCTNDTLAHWPCRRQTCVFAMRERAHALISATSTLSFLHQRRPVFGRAVRAFCRILTRARWFKWRQDHFPWFPFRFIEQTGKNKQRCHGTVPTANRKFG